MTIIYSIEQDFISQNAWYMYLEDVQNLYKYELGEKVFITHENRSLAGLGIAELDSNVEEEQLEEYDSKTIVTAKGYSQGDWEEYTLYYNEAELSEQELETLEILKVELSKLYTHKNDYSVTALEVREIDGKQWSTPYEVENGLFSITHVEFPEDEDIVQAFKEVEQPEGDYKIVCTG